MFEVRIHGRGGQGFVTAAELLSVAAFVEARHAQALPSFGSERTGAPVVSFCRIADVPIRTREPLAAPDALIVQERHAAASRRPVRRPRPRRLHARKHDAQLRRARPWRVRAAVSRRAPAHRACLGDRAPAAWPAAAQRRAARRVRGRHVAVYGGGNTALDAARTAKRLGATDAVVVYRRTRDRMPAHDFEFEEAREEGVTMKWLSVAREGSLVLMRMAIDDHGLPQPTGELEELAADTRVLALGQQADLALLEGVAGLEAADGVVTVDATMMTGHPGIFAGGDMVPAQRMVTVAVGHGKRAAHNIDGWLRGRPAVPPLPREPVAFEQLNTWYVSDAPASVAPRLELARRTSAFDEVQGDFDDDTALYEARRCPPRGNCLECDTCYGVCPHNAVIKLGPGKRYEINLDYCRAAASASRSARAPRSS